ncbi:MAG: class II aldolase/adducin family protein [Clostridia bacterium]
MQKYTKQYEKEIRELADACNLLGKKKLTSSVGGNLSLRVSPEHILITPTSMQKEFIKPEDICIVDYAGKTIYAREGLAPTSETPFHIMVMNNRTDIVSAVHAHCTVLSAFAISKTNWLEQPFFPEPSMEIGPIITVPYVEPSCDRLADQIQRYVHKSNGFLLQNHGALALSAKSVGDAVEKLYMMESIAKSVYMAVTLGETKKLTKDEIRKIEELQLVKGLKTETEPITESFLFD